jgi:hypothetical protein
MIDIEFDAGQSQLRAGARRLFDEAGGLDLARGRV